MTENRFKDVLVEHRTTAKALCQKVQNIGQGCMSYIVNGTAMPTRESMQSICEVLSCKATDIWNERDLDLNVTREARMDEKTERIQHDETSPAQSIRLDGARDERSRGHGHEGQDRLFFWFAPEEKIALAKAVRGLGYKSMAEWMREMYRQTLRQYAVLTLGNGSLNDLVAGQAIPYLVSMDT